ncbi:MAG: hypothetical protein J0I77_01590 [Rudaea sp.]|uniref:protein YgfX n=1 Tax=unclassified Rudaea TaxID=2627037 RepID=UPI0010F9A6E5|nr:MULTISPECIES: protein YgfX [unclassified Rudaea]MBN8884386.1 hypothetical protein [Rudaea sp.]MBR0344352.1 hypothetical protein [Rudaea sp.]
MKSVPAIAFDYRPSRWLMFGIGLATLLAVLAIAVCGLSLWFKLALMLAALAYAGQSLWRFSHPPFTQIMWHSAGHWRLGDKEGGEHIGELVRAVTLGMLIVLVLKVGAKATVALPLLPDNCDAETRRRLRVRLARADSVHAVE